MDVIFMYLLFISFVWLVIGVVTSEFILGKFAHIKQPKRAIIYSFILGPSIIVLSLGYYFIEGIRTLYKKLIAWGEK